MITAAQRLRITGSLDLSRTLARADFITDSLTMTLLFKIAEATCLATPQGVPAGPMPQLTILSQYVHGKVFMKALGPTDDAGPVKKTGAGQPFPPQYNFCERMKLAHPQTFQRVTEYGLNYRSDSSPADPGVLNIVIHDVDLAEPTPSASCLSQGCAGHHGYEYRHAVPFVAPRAHDTEIGEQAVLDRHMTSDILPRAYFAGCYHVVVYQHTSPLAPFELYPRFFYSTVGRELEGHAMAEWVANNLRALCCLARILRVVQTDSRSIAARDP
jgi:hypothetical protein